MTAGFHARTALLLSGLQNDFCHIKGALATAGAEIAEIQEMLPHARRVLDAARAAELLIVHVPERVLASDMSDSTAWREQYARNGWATAIAAEGSWGEQFVDGFEPLAGEPVVHRYRPGALYDTRASVLLRSARISRVVVVGAETHRTILATAVQGVSLDYEVTVPIQAVASSDPRRGAATIEVLGSWVRLVDVDDLVEELGAPAIADVARDVNLVEG